MFLASMENPLRTVLSTISFLVLAALAVRVVHMRFLHPLRRFPGPWLRSISQIPTALDLLRANQPMVMRKLHEKYGPIVRLAPNELSFIDADAWEAIFGFQKNGPNFEKSELFIGAVNPLNGSVGISLAPNEIHTRQRKALAAPFTNKALLQQESILQRHVDKFIAAMKTMANGGQAVNLADWYTFVTFDMIGDICFAEPFGCLDTGASTEWAASICNIFKSAVYDQAIRRLTKTGSFLHKILLKLIVPADAARWRQVHFQNSKEKTMRRLADPDRDHPDLIKHILDNEDSRKALTETEIVLNMVLFISAGSETTANLITGWTYFMLRNPAKLARATAEVRSAFATAQAIRWEGVKNLKYLDATIHEALRLFSPAAANQMRVVPAGGATVCGHFLPGGTTAGIAPYAAVHSPRNFSHHEAFAPERWLDGGDARYAGDRLHASQAFSVGPRGCIGRNLSWMEMRLILSNLLWHFDLALDEERPAARAALRKWDEFDIESYATWMKPDLQGFGHIKRCY
ncbi:cytochrome P450 [Apiospora hydei]|uniref:Cytochrome P450 n=1 Tax=Apiospora hydei TaxID=1337664 RepID=A0ABR1UV17_9PEZI